MNFFMLPAPSLSGTRPVAARRLSETASGPRRRSRSPRVRSWADRASCAASACTLLLPWQAGCQKGNDTPKSAPSTRVFARRYGPPRPFGDARRPPRRGRNCAPKSAADQTIVRTSTASPRRQSEAARTPAASSTTAKARHAARTLHGPTPGEAFRTVPRRFRNSRSSGNPAARHPPPRGGAGGAGRAAAPLAGVEAGPAEEAVAPGDRVEGGHEPGRNRLAGSQVPEAEATVGMLEERREAVSHGLL